MCCIQGHRKIEKFLRKAIEGLKHGTKPEPVQEPKLTFTEREPSEELTEAIGLMEGPRWTLIHSLTVS